jgi:uncharacterized protein (TIGR02145 family)
MRIRQNISILPLLIMGVFLVFSSSCEKDKDNEPSSNNPTNGKTTAVFNPSITYGTIKDYDGNIYKTVTIGSQTWMAENLRTTRFNDGGAIPNVTDNDDWMLLKTGAYCNYDNKTDTVVIATYGRLYNGYAVNTGKLAPAGWHVPTDAEWSTLITFLGGDSLAGCELKESGTTHWNSPNTKATNETGFTFLPGGIRFLMGPFNSFGFYGSVWSATDFNASSLWVRSLYYTSTNVGRTNLDKALGCSVRCIKD